MPEEELPFEEALVEAGVVGDEERIAGKREEAAEHTGDRRCAPQLLLAETCQPCDGLGKRDLWVDEGLKRVDELECAHANGPDLADLATNGREARGFQIEDDELCFLQQRIGSGFGQGDGGAGEDDAAVTGRYVREQRTSEACGDRRRREEQPGRLDSRHRAVLLEQVHQAVERVECELHRSDESEHMFAWQALSPGEAAPPAF
jgi:hypothetical protein